MKKALIPIFILCHFLLLVGAAPLAADTLAQDGPPSGRIEGGFRVLEIPGDSRELNLKVYRGDYIKFRFESDQGAKLLEIPDLAIRQPLSGPPAEAPYFKMEKTGVFLFTLGSARGSLTVIDYRQANYREVSAREAAELIRNIKPLVLDVRTAAEYGRGHLKDSVLIPVQNLQARWQEIAGYKDRDVLIYCATGNRSTVAAKILIDNGFKRIFNLRQGISGWERERFPVEK